MYGGFGGETEGKKKKITSNPRRIGRIILK
jgi:hypothetical protein